MIEQLLLPTIKTLHGTLPQPPGVGQAACAFGALSTLTANINTLMQLWKEREFRREARYNGDQTQKKDTRSKEGKAHFLSAF